MQQVDHASFTIKRTLNHPVAAVYKAFADPVEKAKWFGGPKDQIKLIESANDFRVGGRDRLAGAWIGKNLVSRFDCTYFDIVPNTRIVYAYEMHLNEKKISVSLATLEFLADGGKTHLIVTEQGAFLDGYDDNGSREQGTNALLDAMAASLEKAAA
jgi:uncharacterized protein YndB with AHSA1/START domain